MVQSPSSEANWFAPSQEIPRISRNPNVHYRTHKRPPPVSILGQPNPVHIPTSHLLEIHPNIKSSTYLHEKRNAGRKHQTSYTARVPVTISLERSFRQNKTPAILQLLYTIQKYQTTRNNRSTTDLCNAHVCIKHQSENTILWWRNSVAHNHIIY